MGEVGKRRTNGSSSSDSSSTRSKRIPQNQIQLLPNIPCVSTRLCAANETQTGIRSAWLLTPSDHKRRGTAGGRAAP